VLMHTLDILDLLRGSDAPLKMHEISEATGVSLTTTYRILQTLLHRGYLAQDRMGRLTLLDRPELKSATVQDTSLTAGLVEPDLSGKQVIEILHRVPRTLRERERTSFDSEIAGRRSLQRRRI
jgi:hypothetical protein